MENHTTFFAGPMQYLDLEMNDPWLDVALDEALVEQADRSSDHAEVLRVWEPTSTAVIVGRSSPLAREVNVEACRGDGVPVIRRSSGGASIVTGPGCLMYAVLLSYTNRPEVRMLDAAHQFVMGRLAHAMSDLGLDVEAKGICDLTLGQRKFSGNALRCKRNWMVYHGTILCTFETSLIDRYLGMPVRQPEYRRGRGHSEFVTRLDIPTTDVRAALKKAWRADEPFAEAPIDLAHHLAATKYRTEAWTWKH